MSTAQQSFPLWGGTATVATVEPARLALARATVDRVVAAVDVACSSYRDDSELARVNAAAGHAVPVGGLFVQVVRAAIRAAELTNGMVDPTATRPGEPRATGRRRSGTRGGRAYGWRSINLSPAAGTASVPKGVALDLGAIGKAFAADTAARLAAGAAECGVLVALAGDIAVAGEVPADGWPVRVADDHRTGPNGELPPGQDITLRAPGGLATSSLAVRTIELPSGTVTHIVDPRSGMPVRGPWRTASVAAGTCVDANTASTAAIVCGPGAAAWLAERGLPARLVHVEGWVTTVADWPAAADVPGAAGMPAGAEIPTITDGPADREPAPSAPRARIRMEAAG
ncbi:MAG TPA: FAD:protein FMN transferase [Streptosporangiaceae bacterium]